tara:strand:- start:1929 stop:2945 length:1017 start_codon:yes stop_codon:yes gene_type:complete
MIIKSDGKVGIGTSSPASKLHVKKDDSTAFSASSSTWHNIVVSNENTTGGTRTAGIAFELNGYHANAGTGIAAVKNGTADDYGADLAFITRPQSAVAEERLRITDTGNVGIGTTTPQKKLEVWTGNGELSHFGSSSANAVGNYTGISLGYAENGNTAYRKVGIVGVGRGDGAARQDLAFLVDSNGDGGSAQLADTKMRISHEGYVTTPNQPSFRAYLNASVGGGNVVSWTGTFHNIGSHFSTANGRFTAPVAGVYQINLHYLSDNNSSQCDVYIRVNGVPNNGARTRSATGTGHETTSASHAISLSVGDYVDVQNGGSSVFYGDTSNTWSSFSGYLIG